MSRHITDDQMRSLWKRRCQARETLAKLGKYGLSRRHREIHDFTHDEKKAMRRNEYALYWATKDIERGLRQRASNRFYVGAGTYLILGDDGHLVPVWGWMWTTQPNYDYANLAANLMPDIAERKRREAVAC